MLDSGPWNSETPGPKPNTLAKRGWAGTVSEVLRSHSAEDGFLLGCYSFLGLEPSRPDLAALPLYDFFRRYRIRVLHQDGTAGNDLVEFAESKQKELEAGLKSLGAAVYKMAPELPQLEATEPIVLTPAHAILFLIVTRDLFKALASHIRPILDESGYLRMTPHYAYSIPHHPFRRVNYKDAWTPATTFLDERYHVRKVDKHDLVRKFRRLELWESMSDRFNELSSKEPADCFR